MDYYLTAEKLEQLKKELTDLRTNARIEIAERLKKAKELGDLSENSEYIGAKEDQEQIERKIVELDHMIKNAIIIKKPEVADTIHIGSTFEAEKDGTTMKFTIVGSEEARPEAGLISNASPLGRAFLGRREGDVVTVKVPAGEVTYKIIKIE